MKQACLYFWQHDIKFSPYFHHTESCSEYRPSTTSHVQVGSAVGGLGVARVTVFSVSRQVCEHAGEIEPLM